VAVRRIFRQIETRTLPNIVKIDSVGPVVAACGRDSSAVSGDEECIVVVGYRQIEVFADGLAVRVGRGHRNWGVAYIADGRGTRDDAGVGINVLLRSPQGLADPFGCSRVEIVTFPDGTYFQSGAWYPSPPALGFYR
jgi:hypothetical protein